MATLNDILKESTSVISLGPLASENHFTATAKVLGIATVYVLKGEDVDLESTIVGRIELGTMARPSATVYEGGNLKGGTFSGMASDGLQKALEDLAA